MRNALARTLYELAKADPRIVVLVADISPAGAMEDFRKTWPDRFINVGVAEQSMIGLAAGLAMRGFRPFCYTIATFALFRAYEFIRCDLAYQDLPVTIVGMGAGLSYSTLGGTHQAIEDVAVAMACPNMNVLAPCDPAETAECVRWCAARESGGPTYLRIGKAGEPDLTSDLKPWKFGRIRWLRPGTRGNGALTVLSYGPAASIALAVADRLKASMEDESGKFCGPDARVGVVPSPSHVDQDDVVDVMLGRCVVIEEASGAPLARFLNGHLEHGRAVYSVALPREFPHAHGTREELLALAGLTADSIVARL